MPRIRICIVIDAPPPVVWREVERLEDHVHWMADAQAIQFLDGQHRGVGTQFDCPTRIWRFHTVDRMVVTQWEPNQAMEVVHRGLVTGIGRFSLKAKRPDRTRFCWDERLSLPWWLGGPIGGLVATPILYRVWRRSLSQLKQRIETTTPPT